jgi:DUF971 family protein
MSRLIKIERIEGDRLKFTWDDGFENILSLKFLRRSCPCATCSAGEEFKRKGPEPAQYEIKNINPIGNYAIQIIWKDGHDTGIYPFELLRTLKEY